MTALFACSYTSVWLKFLYKQGFVLCRIGFLLALAGAPLLPLLLVLCQKGKLNVQEDLGLLHKELSVEKESESHPDVPKKTIRSPGPISQDKIGHDFVCLFYMQLLPYHISSPEFL